MSGDNENILTTVSVKTLKAMQAQGPAKISKLHVLKVKILYVSMVRTNVVSHKLLPVQQDLQMLHLPVHPLYCEPGAEDLQVSQRLWPYRKPGQLCSIFNFQCEYHCQNL